MKLFRLMGGLAFAGTFATSAVVGCGTSESTAPTPTPGAACDAIFDGEFDPARCGGMSIPASVLAPFKARFHTFCVQQMAYPGFAGTWQECASAMASAPCRGSSPNVAIACAFVGSLANGAPCNGGSQCQSGECSKGTLADGGTSSCGLCAPSIARGQACKPGDSCIPGTECLQGICTAYGSSDIGGPCLSANDCKATLECQSQKCVALQPAGGPCTGDYLCQQGLRCSQQKCTVPIAVGGDCSVAPDVCPNSTLCDTKTKKCTLVAFAQKGQTCGNLSPPTLCASTLDCPITDLQTMTGTCPTVLADGQPCDPKDKTTSCDLFASCRLGVCTFMPAICQ
jgi:hypothetical protein